MAHNIHLEGSFSLELNKFNGTTKKVKGLFFNNVKAVQK